MDNTFPPTEQSIGVPFSVQPLIQILDEYGNPLKNKYVVAVSSPEPFIPKTGISSNQAAYIDGLKKTD